MESNEKICYINQPFGLGDILICEPIARHYYDLGYKIKYWVRDDYMWIQDYIQYINFLPMSDPSYTCSPTPIFEENIIYLPVMELKISSDEDWKKTGWLYDKYRISNLDYNLWKNFKYTRNLIKEEELFKFLNLKDKKYIVINEYSSQGKRQLDISSEYDIIKMRQIDGYTLLDWIKVLEKAEEVHTVSTSVVFLLITIKHKNVTIYNRSYNKDGTFNSIEEIFQSYNFKYE